MIPAISRISGSSMPSVEQAGVLTLIPVGDPCRYARLFHAERGAGGRPDTDPRRGGRWVRVVGDLVLVERDPHLVTERLGRLAVDADRTDVDEGEMRVGATRHDAQPLVGEPRRERPRVPNRSLRVLAEGWRHRLLQRDSLPGDVVLD